MCGEKYGRDAVFLFLLTSIFLGDRIIQNSRGETVWVIFLKT